MFVKRPVPLKCYAVHTKEVFQKHDFQKIFDIMFQVFFEISIFAGVFYDTSRDCGLYKFGAVLDNYFKFCLTHCLISFICSFGLL